jgi:hypothetical protein
MDPVTLSAILSTVGKAVDSTFGFLLGSKQAEVQQKEDYEKNKTFKIIFLFIFLTLMMIAFFKFSKRS